MHLEGFYGYPLDKLDQSFLPADERDTEATLVLAGDISSRPDQLGTYLRHVASRFKHVVYVPGNHEFYRWSFDEWRIAVKRELEKCTTNNIHTPLDDVGSYEIDGVLFVVGTMWGEGSENPLTQMDIEYGINDFRLIYTGTREDGSPKRFTARDMMQLADDQRKEIYYRVAQSKPDQKIVVVTHHMPLHEFVAARFRQSTVNGAFVADCSRYIDPENPPTIHVFGHTHDTIDATIDGTRYICNPAGYRSEWGTQYNRYDMKKFITL